MRNVFYLILLAIILIPTIGGSQNLDKKSLFTIARLKYQGGGDWYNDPSIIPNLLAFLAQETNIHTAVDEKKVEIMDQDFFAYPFIFMTGHGRITFSDDEAQRLRKYLVNGGFLYADDDYGMDKYFRAMMKKVFPDKDLVELPFNHPIYHCHFHFAQGVPKIHEHDGGPPHAYGIFHEGRMVVYYTFNTNISDGWADPDVHKDPEEVRLQALRMGVNIVVYALTN
ncbi:MAG: DUF4159 domain-containing protein [candidate division KSB1 bacterium]|nr:DUF4159 domain-containing protein [candidate division KSB1 bacterium]MDZ7335283.1 DUF4159 domain-containing protein [candidate division KSB1 bacterium]MDZ7358658.1 DUF4159 domain-containing protein [candidate division KSB1 bacterium]MDZ7377257.1 DUF4159 domain-containing protein [candidate division KSB1 bacterium]MDZ7399820.1 DUF4159 domain-containing protein [candidate division KSB1 bacterium]